MSDEPVGDERKRFLCSDDGETWFKLTADELLCLHYRGRDLWVDFSGGELGACIMTLAAAVSILRKYTRPTTTNGMPDALYGLPVVYTEGEP